MAEYRVLTIAELKEILKDRKIPLTKLKRKAQMIDRLVEDDEQKVEAQDDGYDRDGQPKRKRDGDGNGGNTRVKSRRTFDSFEEANRWQQQYYQGKKHSELPSGIGCGTCTFISPWVSSQSPIHGPMRFEVQTGTGGPEDGSIRLCASDSYWPFESDWSQPIFLVPLTHVEQVIVIGRQYPGVPKSEAYQAIIIPTAATGSFSLVRESPEIITFSWPDQKADKQLGGMTGEAADTEKDSYLAVFERVINERLKPLGKSVTVLDASKENDNLGAIVKAHTDKGSEKGRDILGVLYFPETGILFLSEKTKLYLPFESILDVIVVRVRDLATRSKNPVCVELHVRAIEPYYKTGGAPDANGDESDQGYTLISFKDILVKMLDKIRAYASKYDVKVKECEQMFYDYAKDEPATGWNPLM